MNKAADAVLQKEMSRQEFLATMGLGMASIMGFSQIVRILTGKSVDHHFRRHGYGSSPYGRNKR